MNNIKEEVIKLEEQLNKSIEEGGYIDLNYCNNNSNIVHTIIVEEFSITESKIYISGDRGYIEIQHEITKIEEIEEEWGFSICIYFENGNTLILSF